MTLPGEDSLRKNLSEEDNCYLLDIESDMIIWYNLLVYFVGQCNGRQLMCIIDTVDYMDYMVYMVHRMG